MENTNEIIWTKEKGFDFTDTIKPEIIETPTYDYWNSQNTLDYNVALRNKPKLNQNKYCFANITSNKTLNSWTSFVITFDKFETNDSWMSTTSDRIIITQNWQYHLCWLITYSYVPWWVREGWLRYTRNWTTTTIVDTYQSSPWAGISTTIALNTILTLEVWDYIQMRAYQDSWVTCNISSWISQTYLRISSI